jgi:hypothetical protein
MFGFALCLIDLPFSLRLAVARKTANRILDRALGLIPFACDIALLVRLLVATNVRICDLVPLPGAPFLNGCVLVRCTRKAIAWIADNRANDWIERERPDGKKLHVLERLLVEHKAPYTVTVARNVGYALCQIAP